eukprot:jgi/Picre1/33761/NNA_001240.t1
MTVNIDSKTGPWPRGLSTKDLVQSKVKDAKVLVVGAGGIGCELLKTLALSGFQNIHVVDLDTIDVSNLNRQFLFRKHHVGQSKSSVAAAAIKKFRPDMNIVAEMSNIMLPEYDVKFFKRFDIVLNGLDNIEARRHVNRMCLCAQVPLVESGTAGYLGQVTVHLGLKTECFDCQPKPTQKSFAVCTIRRTPEKPIHCIVWSKEVAFQGLFGDGDLADIGDHLAYEKDSIDAKEYEKSFQNPFHDNINGLLKEVEQSEEDVWKGRDPPKPLDVEGELKDDIEKGLDPSWSPPIDQHRVLDVHESTQMFVQIYKILTQRANSIGSLEFDKDDDDVMQFVAASSNLRSFCYGIAPQSFFQAKGMAGNIIHAIATTNAIVSGLIVVQAMKVLAGAQEHISKYRAAYIQQYPSNKKIIAPIQCMPPNKDCPVCSLVPLQLPVNTTTVTFGRFINEIVRSEWGFKEFLVDNGADFLFEEGEFLEEDEIEANKKYLDMPLRKLPGGGIVNNSVVTVTDEGSNLKVPVIIIHVEETPDTSLSMSLQGDLEQAKKAAAREQQRREEQEKRDKEEIHLVDDDDHHDKASLKRKREDIDGQEEEDEDVVLILDD